MQHAKERCVKILDEKNWRGLLADLGAILRLFSRKAGIQLAEFVSGGIMRTR